ncbi:MAG TPA: bifunctional 3,4-dihydroxy-2-butanone-4-phosphate synthase/GTP cyclohydrolase II, partial [Methylophilaceae bacterium]|nr:bifunctional 3,4-dihydroxy-2-butanone-4-phosphate synthase/GTP cyclohydrolase II [Methylophilaceae bacterium]
DKIAQETHLALIKGEPWQSQEVLVRVHEPLSVIDLLDSSNHSHSWNIHRAMQAISQAECGVIVLLHHDENGQQIIERIQHADQKIRYNQELRTYGIGSQILLDLGVRKMKLLATPRKMPSMMGFGLEVTGFLEDSLN